ncbi:unnamed protein product, partial [Hapterophycus canaliculatus]
RKSLARRSTRSTLSIASSGSSSDSSSSGSSSSGGGRLKGHARKRTNREVRFSHEVSVVTEWEDHLAQSDLEVKATSRSRDRATTMVEGDDFWCLVEGYQLEEEGEQSREARKVVVVPPPPRVLSRAARFAMSDDDYDYDDDDGDSASRQLGGVVCGAGRGGRNGLAYGRMRDILASGRASANIDDSGQSLNWEGMKCYDDGDDDEDDGDEEGRTKGWKDGSRSGKERSDARTSRRARGKRGNERPSLEKLSGFGPKSTSMEEESLYHVSVDNSVLKEELFGLAIEERRTSVLFKRAFLNWERSAN